ncbi:MAG: ATP-binding cassette domain-containing protein, partial [Actinomycetota bacterium]|nr:ATP-binding cassette domain-containing protein [Actinomycetota bacterium]
MNRPALVFSHVTITVPGRVLVAGADLEVQAGEVVVMLGRSGTGKTSMINVAAGISRPSAGLVAVAGEEITSASGSARARHRLRRIGLVFQFAELLPELTVGENVALPLLLAGASRAEAATPVEVALARVGLDGYDDRWPELISGGEAQRAAIARAIASSPALVLADEPTGA